MTDARATREIGELGPVDWLVVEFPGSSSNDTIAAALADLEEAGTMRVLDLLLLKKDENGGVEAFELSDVDAGELGELCRYESRVAMLLSEDDVTALAAAIDPGTRAACLVFENTWAAPLTAAVRDAGGQLVASGRIATQALLAAIESDVSIKAD